jgi:acetyltransferase
LTASFLDNANQIPRGSIAVVAQSAGVNLTVSFLLERQGCGVSLAVGLGNALDVGAAEALEFLADHKDTNAIALHLEGVPRGRRLYDVVRSVTAKKPVVVLTVGKEEVGEFARSHTGNLIGSYTVRRNALLQAGAVVVDTIEALAAAVAVLSVHRLAPKRQPGVGVLTAQGGPGLLMLDQLKSAGVTVPTLSPATVSRIAKHLPPMTYLRNPVDTGRPRASFPGVLETLADDDKIDLVIAYVLHEPAALRAAEVIPRVAAKIAKPLVFGTVGATADLAPTLAALRSKGVFVAGSPDELARAATVLTRDAAQRARALENQTPSAAPIRVSLPAHCDEHSAKQTLNALGIRTPRAVAASTHEEALDAFTRLDKPVVVKILSAEITHKTEVNGVHLNICDEAALRAALTQLDTIPNLSDRRYLIEEMAPAGLELIVGATRDPSFGPTVTVGLGGTFAEALKDTATRMAPLPASEAHDMLNELRAAPLLEGWRGGPKLDRDAVAHCIKRLGDLLWQHSNVEALEVNPLRVYERGVLALDAVLLYSST